MRSLAATNPTRAFDASNSRPANTVERDEQWVPHSVKQPPVFGRGSLILADNKLIALGEGGLLGIIKLNPKQCEETCRFQAPQLHYPCWAAPILSDKKMFIRSEDRLVCYNLAK